jgi:hypothetical protein
MRLVDRIAAGKSTILSAELRHPGANWTDHPQKVSP